MKPRARLSRWLAPLSVSATIVALTVGACSVPEFDFASPLATGGDGANPSDPCHNKQIDASTGETDFDCGGACGPCALGKHCMAAPDCAADALCHEGTCVGLGCVNQAQDGSESDVDCGGSSCKTCITGQNCVAPTDCESGVCFEDKCAAPTCTDQVSNGKETGLDCGGECSPCPVDQPCVVAKDCISSECNDKTCGPECPDGFANCDKQNANACEVNTRTDLANCGFCGNACKLPNATAECSAGECRIKTDGCAAGFEDCNGDPADGCEVDLNTNKLNCGACNKVCPSLNGAPSCAAGACQITCTDGFEDCDDSRDNGCEINLHTNSNNCGVCAKKCAAAVGYSAYCKDSACGQTMCAAGKGDCNGEQGDGCEINLTNDVNNCGDCGHVCSANNANVACVNSKCVITSCKAAHYADCDSATPQGFQTGCETDTDVATDHCGSCAKACTTANGTAKCEAGTCAVGSCGTTFRDCDGDYATGCEVNVATNGKNCGGCGAAGSDCTAKYPHASSACMGSACATPSCNPGYGDCIGGLADGCETDTTKDTNNCGACGTHCDPQHSSSTKCVSSACTSMCDAGWDKCKTAPDGCSTQLGTAKNCSKCGEACAAGGFCDPGGCVDHRDIVVVDKGTHAVNGWDGGANVVAQITLDHVLQTAKLNNRMIVVGIACTDNYTNPESVSVTYAGTPMLPAVKQEDAGKHSFAGIYYLLDAALPDSPSTNQVIASFGPAFTWGHAGVDVMELKNTMQVGPIATGGTPGDNCGGSSSRSVAVTFSQTGSLVYGVLSARGASAATLSSSSGLVETWNQLQPTPDKMVGAAAYVPDNDNRTITWSVANCYNSAGAVAAIKRLSAN